jgi:glucose-6-phosphate isomerase
VVNLGIGGSDLGPRMAVQALGEYADPNSPCASSPTSTRPSSPTRCAISTRRAPCSSSPRRPSRRRRRWPTPAPRSAWLGAADPARHFLAVSNNVAAAQAFGIPAENCLAMAEWVGGRFSMWSAIGLPLACSIGMDAFEDLLAGAREMDEHFLSAPYAENLPVLMALVGLWNIDFLGAESLAVIPYAHRLGLLPAYLQQLEMESNGKRVTLDNRSGRLRHRAHPLGHGRLGRPARLPPALSTRVRG